MDKIHVISSDYKDIGMIGPDDKITLYYKIKADENTPSGTYFLDFNVKGGYDMIQINREIPVRVDSSAVNIARADVPTKPSIDQNVPNPRENTLNAVTIDPSAPGIGFSPDQYYIASTDPDEVFTDRRLMGSRLSYPAIHAFNYCYRCVLAVNRYYIAEVYFDRILS
jgi:hypothetical protein